MPGKIKTLIDELVELRTRGRPALRHFIRAHLVLNGIDPEQHTSDSADDPETISQLRRMIAEFKRSK